MTERQSDDDRRRKEADNSGTKSHSTETSRIEKAATRASTTGVDSRSGRPDNSRSAD
jgi:hypothetical protein